MARLYIHIVCFVLLTGASMTVLGEGAIPPPTVNQNIGLPDTQFDLSTSGECRACHYKPYPDGIVYIWPPTHVDGYLADRHHQHIGTEIAGGSEQPPFMDAWGDGVEDTVYSCANCHQICGGEPCRSYPWLDIDWNCLSCHIVEGGERTVHHDTPKAKEGECAACHGSVVRSLDAGLAPPTWSPTLITPWPRGNPNGDTRITSPAGTHPGNCDFCHSPTGADIQIIDVFPGPIRVFSNEDTHHGTGVLSFETSEIVGNEAVCNWCHLPTFPVGYTPYPDEPLEPWAIRGCMRCHDIESLHSIQYDAAGDGVVPGLEEPFQGHVGDRDDCWGCHGNIADIVVALSATAGTGATTSQLDHIDALTWKEGEEFVMRLSGSGFINQGGLANGVTFRPMVQLTDSEGTATTLAPIAESVSSAYVNIPGTLPVGNYVVQIKKDEKLSNPMGATITPPIALESAVCYQNYKVVIIRGDNLGDYFPGGIENTETGVTADGFDADAIYRWKAGMIAARFNGGCPSTVVVHNVFDSAAITPVVR